jgi:hypothetical protein
MTNTQMICLGPNDLPSPSALNGGSERWSHQTLLTALQQGRSISSTWTNAESGICRRRGQGGEPDELSDTMDFNEPQIHEREDSSISLPSTRPPLLSSYHTNVSRLCQTCLMRRARECCISLKMKLLNKYLHLEALRNEYLMTTLE